MHSLANRFLGLAPFLRMSIQGDDLTSLGNELLAKATEQTEDANLWMNLSIVMFCLGHRELGLTIQSQALQMSRIYHLACSSQPPKLRLLLLVAPGDLSANTPLDCLLEDGDIELSYYFISAEEELTSTIPDHDVLMVAFSELEGDKLLAYLDQRLKNWPHPVINTPLQILTTRRDQASKLLQDIPGLTIPPTIRVTRNRLASAADELTALSRLYAGCNFPVILRPVDSHAGNSLIKAENALDIADYLSRVHAAEFFLSSFIDYSGPDGQFRKFRIALIDGQPFACHMAVSSHWMVHYLNAGMYEDANKRSEERSFMENFDQFACRHQTALAEIYRRSGLDYFCIDCAETRTGELLIFEIDHVMVVHAMDSKDLFPYKQLHMQKVKMAFRDFLLRLVSEKNTPLAG
jgi:glutathione synthase/RimK-type ligase-like ATP-grasp enzyme